jgi:hypothetical protein
MEQKHQSCARDCDLKDKPHQKRLEPSGLTRFTLSQSKEIDIEEHHHVHHDHKEPTHELQLHGNSIESQGRHHRVSLLFACHHLATQTRRQVLHEQIQQPLPSLFQRRTCGVVIVGRTLEPLIFSRHLLPHARQLFHHIAHNVFASLVLIPTESPSGGWLGLGIVLAEGSPGIYSQRSQKKKEREKEMSNGEKIEERREGGPIPLNSSLSFSSHWLRWSW